MYSAYKLNKQGDNIQPWRTPFPIWNQSVVPCAVLCSNYHTIALISHASNIPVRIPLFPFNSHNILKVDIYNVYYMNEATQRGEETGSSHRVKTQACWASKLCPITSHRFVQVLCDLGFKCNCSFLFFLVSEAETREQLPGNCSSQRPQFQSPTCRSMNICRTSLNFLLIWIWMLSKYGF